MDTHSIDDAITVRPVAEREIASVDVARPWPLGEAQIDMVDRRVCTRPIRSADDRVANSIRPATLEGIPHLLVSDARVGAARHERRRSRALGPVPPAADSWTTRRPDRYRPASPSSSAAIRAVAGTSRIRVSVARARQPSAASRSAASLSAVSTSHPFSTPPVARRP